jgi:hypothetical protein
MAPLTFHPTTVPAIAKAQAAFRQRVEPGSPIPARSPTTVTTRQ